MADIPAWFVAYKKKVDEVNASIGQAYRGSSKDLERFWEFLKSERGNEKG
jgi:hypothetical protein